MKRTILSMLCLATASYYTQAQVALPNAGFENWDAIGSYEEPTDWSSANECSAQISVYAVAKSSDAHTGSYSAHMVTQDALFGSIKINGVITTSTMICDPLNPGITGGISYSGRPDSIVGWYKYAPSSTDNAYVQAMFLNSTANPVDTIGYVKYDMSAASSWTRFSAAIVYESADIPDQSSVLFNSSWGNGNNNEGFAGSDLLVDDIEFIVNTVGINDPDMASWSVFPNPVEGELHIRAAYGEKAELEILDVTGKRVKLIKLSEQESIVDVSQLVAGVYLYRLSHADNSVIRTGKLLVNP